MTVEGKNQECNYLEFSVHLGFQAKRVAWEYTFEFPTYAHDYSCDRNDTINA